MLTKVEAGLIYTRLTSISTELELVKKGQCSYKLNGHLGGADRLLFPVEDSRISLHIRLSRQGNRLDAS